MKTLFAPPTRLSVAPCLIRGAIVCGVFAGLAACGSVPTTRFHSLLSVPSANAPATPSAGAVPVYFELVPIEIPPQVDQPQFVVRNADDSLLVLEQERWIAPLADEMRGALTEELAARFNLVEVRQAVPGQRAAVRVRVDVLRFESLPGREVRLEANWSARSMNRGSDENAPTVSCHSEIRQGVAAGYNALASGHRKNVVTLADQIGAAIKALQGGTPVCPSA